MSMPSLMPFCKEGPQRICSKSSDFSGLALAPQFPMTGNVTLLEVLAFVKVSKASAYKFGIVAMFDDDGVLIETGKIPPFPWTRMPHPIINIKKGKKLFDAAEIHTWRNAIRDRAYQATHSAVTGHRTQCEVTP